MITKVHNNLHAIAHRAAASGTCSEGCMCVHVIYTYTKRVRHHECCSRSLQEAAFNLTETLKGWLRSRNEACPWPLLWAATNISLEAGKLREICGRRKAFLYRALWGDQG